MATPVPVIPFSQQVIVSEVAVDTPAQPQTQHLGTGPYGEDPAAAAHEKRQKRIERGKKRTEERRQEAKKSTGPGFNRTLGSRNTYFLIAILAIIVIVIVLAIVLAVIVNHPFK